MVVSVPCLSVEDLSYGYPGHSVGQHVSFTVAAGEVLCVLGRNGEGKSTLFKTILGLLPPLAGAVRVDGEPNPDMRRCLFLTFNNSKFTGGTMMIGPNAEIDDGLIEYVRWGPIGRLGLIRNLSTLYDGTHVNHPLAERRPARRIDFHLDGPVDVMVDGEALTLHLETLDLLPSALRVVV